MQKLLETLTRCQHDLDFLRRDLLDANRISSEDAPVVNLVIQDLLSMQVQLEKKLNQLLAGYEEMTGF